MLMSSQLTDGRDTSQNINSLIYCFALNSSDFDVGLYTASMDN
jgi:hypothetical protein